MALASDTPAINDSVQILILDDEAAVTRAVARQLEEIGGAVHRCTDIDQADALQERIHLDVALIDHNLVGSGQSGLAYLTELQQRNPYCYRIIFTGEADFSFAVEAINRGNIDAFLPKPWDDEQLRMLVRQGSQTAWLRQNNALLQEHLARQNTQLERFNAQLEQVVGERTMALAQANHDLEAANQELTHFQRELVHVETQAAISQMVQGLAHELNNPLAVILGYAQRFQRQHENDPGLAKCFRIIREEGERARTLIAQLRRFATRESDAPELCGLENCFAAATDRLQKNRPRLLPCYLHGEDRHLLIGRRALIQVLEQILDNAQENPGASRIDVSCRMVRDRLLLMIDNDGDDPEEDAIRHATKPFFTTKGIDHPGLGLALASSLAGSMGCSLHLEKHPEHAGTRISLFFPPESLESDNPDTASEVPPAEDAPAQPAPTAGEHLLVLDDEDLVRDLVAETCDDLGFSTSRCTTIAEARQALGEQAISALISDVHLPDGDLTAFLDALVAERPGLRGRVLLITGDPEDDRTQALAERHHCRILGKPFRISQLAEAIQAWR